MNTILEGYVSKADLAKHLGRNPRTLDRWERCGEGPPCTRVGSRKLYRIESVQKWLKDREARPAGKRERRA